MDIIQGVLDQQLGKAKLKSYDNVIKRFRCQKEDCHAKLLPDSAETVINDTPIFACKFAQRVAHENWVALANEDGKLSICDVNTKERYGTRAHNNAIFDLAWMFGNMKLVTASGDHTAKLFDAGEADVREVKTFFGHNRSVKSVSFRKDDSSVFATGGRDGNIIVWDTRTEIGSYIGKPDRTIHNSHRVTPSKPRKKCWVGPNIGSKSVTGLAFQNDNTLISCGAGDGVIKVWDLRKNYSRYDPLPKSQILYGGCTAKNGFSSLIVDNNCSKLYVNCLDNSIYSYNINTYSSEPIMKYSGHQNSTFFIKSALSRDGSYLVSGSSDENAYVWSITSSKPLAKLTGHSAEVTCVAWCHVDDLTLVTCSDDMTHRVWRIGSEDLPDNWEYTGRGQVEVIPLSPKKPSKLKRFSSSSSAYALSPAVKRFLKTCEHCDSASTLARFCQNCNFTPGKRKLSPLDGNDTKKHHGDSIQRRLFQNLQSPPRTPTVNLPNYVIDGVAPHLNFSPPKRKDKDWLTKLRIERKFKRDLMDRCEFGAPPSKLSRTETPAQKRCSSPQSPLLRYFKVKCDGHGSAGKTAGSGCVPLQSNRCSHM